MSDMSLFELDYRIRDAMIEGFISTETMVDDIRM